MRKKHRGGIKMMADFDDIIAWEDGRMNEAQEKKFFQKLIDGGEAWRLQGMYGRQAQAMIDAGICHYPKKKIANARNTTDFYGNRIPTHEELKSHLKKESQGWK